MDKNGTIHERISLLVDRFGEGRNTVFASLVDSNEANIRGYVKGVIPKCDILERIVRNLDVNPDWLLTGRGSMLRLEQDLSQATTDLQGALGEASAYYKMYREKDEKVEELLKENARLEERLRLAEAGKSDINRIAGKVSTERTISRAGQDAGSTGSFSND